MRSLRLSRLLLGLAATTMLGAIACDNGAGEAAGETERAVKGAASLGCEGTSASQVLDEAAIIVRSFDESRLYYATASTVYSMAPDGTDRKTQKLHPSATVQRILGADATHVYVKGVVNTIEGPLAAIFRVALGTSSAAPEIVAKTGLPLVDAAVAMDETAVFWIAPTPDAGATSATIYGVVKDGSKPAKALRAVSGVTPETKFTLRVDQKRVYVAYPGAPADTAIHGVEIVGGKSFAFATPRALGEAAPAASDFRSGLRFAESGLLYIGQDTSVTGEVSGPQRIWMLSALPGATSGTVLHTLEEGATASQLSAGGGYVYYTSATATEAALKRLPIGKELRQLLERGQLPTPIDTVTAVGARVTTSFTSGKYLYWGLSSADDAKSAMFRAPIAALKDGSIKCGMVAAPSPTTEPPQADTDAGGTAPPQAPPADGGTPEPDSSAPVAPPPGASADAGSLTEACGSGYPSAQLGPICRDAGVPYTPQGSGGPGSDPVAERDAGSRPPPSGSPSMFGSDDYDTDDVGRDRAGSSTADGGSSFKVTITDKSSAGGCSSTGSSGTGSPLAGAGFAVAAVLAARRRRTATATR